MRPEDFERVFAALARPLLAAARETDLNVVIIGATRRETAMLGIGPQLPDNASLQRLLEHMLRTSGGTATITVNRAEDVISALGRIADGATSARWELAHGARKTGKA